MNWAELLTRKHTRPHDSLAVFSKRGRESLSEYNSASEKQLELWFISLYSTYPSTAMSVFFSQEPWSDVLK